MQMPLEPPTNFLPEKYPNTCFGRIIGLYWNMHCYYPVLLYLNSIQVCALYLEKYLGVFFPCLEVPPYFVASNALE